MIDACTEAQLQDMVLQLARIRGWMRAHFRPAMVRSGKWVTPVQGDGAGFPDLVLLRGQRLLFRELKTDKGKLRPEQEKWLAALLAAGSDANVWRPAQWRNGEIEKELA